jgi:GYF domain 2
LPPEVEAALDKKSSMGILGNLNQYAQFQAANAMEAAAKNPGGANPGLEMGMGMAMAQQMGNMFNQQNQNQPQNNNAGPPPIPGGSSYFIAINGQQQGPFTIPSLQQMLSVGSFNRDSLVWKQGMSGWLKAGDVPELSGLFGAAPPPIPK